MYTKIIKKSNKNLDQSDKIIMIIYEIIIIIYDSVSMR